MKIIFLPLLFSIYSANAENVALELYKPKNHSQNEKILSYKINNVKNIAEIVLKNESKNNLNPICPISVNFLGRSDYEILKDNCSFISLKSNAECSVEILKKSDNKINLKIYSYNNEKLGLNFSLGNKEIINNKIDEVNKIKKKLVVLPLVERIGVGDYYDFKLNLEFSDNMKIINDNENYYAEIIHNKEVFLRIYPKKEDYFDTSIKIIVNNIIYEQPIKFTAIIRKPYLLKIIPNIESISEKSPPVQLKVIANYLKGFPKEIELPNYLINWGKEVSDSGMLQVQNNKNINIKASSMGISSEDLTIQVIKIWPFGIEGDLVVKNNEIKILDKYQYDFNSIIIEKGGLLKVENNQPWIFIGVKNNIIIDGKIVFNSQKYSGDLSSNLPNNDGSLSGDRFEIKTFSNNKNNGGNLYIKANQVEGKGTIDLSSKDGNKGSLVILVRKEIGFLGKMDVQLKSIHKFIDNIVYKKNIIQENKNIKKVSGGYNSTLISSLYYVLRYFILAVIPFVLLYYIFYNKIQSNKIQKEKPKNRQLLMEFFWSIVSAGVINFLVAAFITNFLKDYGYIKIYSNISDYSISYYIFSFLLILILHDIYFYFMHRLLHIKFLYNNVHYIHHKSSNPTPLTALSFHPIEAILHFLFVPIVTCIFPFHLTVISFFLWMMLLFNVNGHNGFEYWHKWWRTGWRLKLFNNSIHHNMHHEYYNCNYSLYFNILDRLFKTNHKDYDKEGSKDVK